MKTIKVIIFLGALFIAGTGILGISVVWATNPVNIDSEGLAINGYDPVAYFIQEKPVRGTAEYTFTWNGAEWRFSSSRHRDLFKSDPEKYAPQYGGY